MQAIAQAAHASNETLYRWYGDKTGLPRADHPQCQTDRRTDRARPRRGASALRRWKRAGLVL